MDKLYRKVLTRERMPINDGVYETNEGKVNFKDGKFIYDAFLYRDDARYWFEEIDYDKSHLDLVKNKFAIEKGFEDFNHLLEETNEMEIIKCHFDNVIKMYLIDIADAHKK